MKMIGVLLQSFFYISSLNFIAKFMSITTKSTLIVLGILLIDQVSKIIVKTNMHLAESIPVFGDWFIIRFIENPGMAFGIDIPGKFGKLSLSLFRLVAIGGIIWYIRSLIKQNAPAGLVICISLILAGAIGNMLDSMFYGLIFNESNFMQIAEFVPEEGGYASFMHGKVVDMLYFPIIEGTYPDWFPFNKGGEHFVFFRPIFNLADTAISVGVIAILIFQKRYFKNL